MTSDFSHYTTDYISGVMSLRDPQKKSLKILEDITASVNIKKGINLNAALGSVHAMYPTCTDFERDFMSLTFALATGVGKTRLMGAFIAYLYTNHGIRNFFVLAPNTTIYDKLKRDLTDATSTKYVFKGLSCFSNPPEVITDDDYKEKQLNLFESEVRIFIYNIDKFNKDNATMRKVNEVIGDSFYRYLSSLDDLVLIMDESHHYRAKKGAETLNDLKPLMGLELTATPLVAKGSKQVPFKNVVYEYPLSKAIEDGYTRTPFAVTRSDIDFYNFGDDQLDMLMLNDGIACHERAKAKLLAYAQNNDKKPVKPFMLVVCKDTDHAAQVEEYVRSDRFRNGAYRNKTIVVHSKQKGSETEANTKLLLDVENPDNPVEIVIHVNMLKEGWDVNSLYTIVPLRTAASKILREQMVGRGLRLPYGERTGDKDVDAVMLTAHDKFTDILEEAQKGDSIFKAGNVIKAEEIKPEKVAQPNLAFPEPGEEEKLEEAYVALGIEKSDEADALISLVDERISSRVEILILHMGDRSEDDVPVPISEEEVQQIVEAVVADITEPDDAVEAGNDTESDTGVSASKDLGRVFRENEMPLAAWMLEKTKKAHRDAVEKYIPIPRIKVTDAGVEEYVFVDFDMELSAFNHTPIQNELLIQNFEDRFDRERIQGDAIDFEGYEPKRAILAILRERPEIDYERTSGLLHKLITQVVIHYEKMHGLNGMRNIVMMHKRDIADNIYKQMMQHFYCDSGFLQEEVVGANRRNIRPTYTWSEQVGLFESYTENLPAVLFTGIRKGVFDSAKFDSVPELYLAQVLETDKDVVNWLRPASKEFNISYNRVRSYEPDFVVETEDVIYLVEVKGENMLDDPDVIAKKNRAVQYCEVASRWGEANGHKEWRYLFIPSKQIQPSSSFMKLASEFRAL